MAIYAVSPAGSDTNPGTAALPWLTLQKAENTVVAGDVVNIASGTYAGFNTSKNGTSSLARITFQATVPGGVVLTSQILIMHNWRTFSGFVFNNVGDRAFQITNGSNNLLYNHIININYASGYGIMVGQDGGDGTLSNNNVLDGIRIVSIFSGAQTVHGILFGGGSSGNVLKNSYLSNTFYGIVNKASVNSLIMNNTFNMTIAGMNSSMYDKGSTNGQYYNNVARNVGSGYCFLVQQSDNGIPPSNGATVRNNVFIKGPDTAFLIGQGVTNLSSDYNVWQYSTTPVVVNNSVPINYNSLAAWQTATGQDAHSIAATPLFVNAGGSLNTINDYRPATGSPVINAGLTLGARTVDAGGNAMVGTPDIGPWEFQTVSPPGNVFYVSLSGNDSNPGTLAQPWRNFEQIQRHAISPGFAAGDTVYIRAGTYISTRTDSTGDGAFNQVACIFFNGNLQGTSAKPITIAAYPPDFVGVNARVVYDSFNNNIISDACYAFRFLNCNWVNVIGVYAKGPQQRNKATGGGNITGGFWSGNTSNNFFINCEASHCETGFRLDDGVNTTYINCDAHDCDDPLTVDSNGSTGPHQGSDGFGRTANGATGTIYRYCRSWNNGDDGWDSIHTPGTITWDTCWAFQNGYSAAGAPLGDGNGFKMFGGSETASTTTASRFLNNCLAAGNKNNGFDQNDGIFLGQLYNNSAINNTVGDYKFAYHGELQLHHIFKNNLSYGNTIKAGTFLSETQYWVQANNDWNLPVTVNASDFVSLDITQLKAPRKADGSLPDITYGHLIAGSDLIDKGVNVNLPFNGSAPDLGFFETGAAATINPVRMRVGVIT